MKNLKRALALVKNSFYIRLMVATSKANKWSTNKATESLAEAAKLL